MGELAVRMGNRGAAVAALQELQRDAARLRFGTMAKSAIQATEASGAQVARASAR
jgi:hypothetical protein